MCSCVFLAEHTCNHSMFVDSLIRNRHWNETISDLVVKRAFICVYVCNAIIFETDGSVFISSQDQRENSEFYSDPGK